MATPEIANPYEIFHHTPAQIIPFQQAVRLPLSLPDKEILLRDYRAQNNNLRVQMIQEQLPTIPDKHQGKYLDDVEESVKMIIREEQEWEGVRQHVATEWFRIAQEAPIIWEGHWEQDLTRHWYLYPGAYIPPATLTGRYQEKRVFSNF